MREIMRADSGCLKRYAPLLPLAIEYLIGYAFRGSVHEARIASNFSSGSSAVAKLRRDSRNRLNSSFSSGPTK